MAHKAIRIIPSASRLVTSLRDLGYDFNQAVADLVDNSIAAGATRVAVDLHFDGESSWLRIVDDGCGMTSAELTEGMRYGSGQIYDYEALGRFGLGLKTASLSQCRRLTVASRRDGSSARIGARTLDLDHVIKTDRWEILELGARDLDGRTLEPLRRVSGTVVLWELLDRILGYKVPRGGHARAGLVQLSEQLSHHLGMVFHRFLAGEVEGRPKLRMLVNGRLIEPWDPFARDEGATQQLPACHLDIETPECVGIVRFQPFVLPTRGQFSTEEAFHRLAGPRKWNAQQGFYIYRANRMIQSGGWCRVRALDEHVKLARASIDFFPELDAAFEINVAKARAVLPSEFREQIREPVEEFVRAAQRAYRANDGSSERKVPATRGDQLVATGIVVEQAARRVGKLTALRAIGRAVRATDPELADRLGW